MKSSLIKIEKGQKVLYDGNIVIIEDFIMVPNGVNDPKLVCLIYAKRENGNIVSATSDKFFPSEDENYEEFYPSVHMSAMEKLKNRRKQILIANLWALVTSFALVFILFFIDSFLKADFDVSIGWLGGITYAFTYFYQLLKQRNINL